MATIATDGDLRIRRMLDDAADYALVSRWRSEPHVHAWWDPDDPPPTPADAEAQYGARARGEEPTTPCIVELDGSPVGYLQFYRWGSWPDADDELDIRADADTYGIDLFIGVPNLVNRGLGTRLVRLVCTYLETELSASCIALTTEIDNVRAQRAYEKAGFRKVRQVLDTDTRDGERVRCWLMERRGRDREELDGRSAQP
jgi:RimJ/RimL family protein N-acetyltransferase